MLKLVSNNDPGFDCSGKMMRRRLFKDCGLCGYLDLPNTYNESLGPPQVQAFIMASADSPSTGL